jgi:hypothetical protein
LRQERGEYGGLINLHIAKNAEANWLVIRAMGKEWQQKQAKFATAEERYSYNLFLPLHTKVEK